ncbi:hypothetical protein IFM89_015033 [Coptis chinensis]|uniref:Uncharacterized protein n=1 Tax=Coptis chinensis TaxID=261450 RepID=A0A835HQ34_9MAGN|nr:hypothetical protein IFM89_015033 [Coptis chinensis]
MHENTTQKVEVSYGNGEVVHEPSDNGEVSNVEVEVVEAPVHSDGFRVKKCDLAGRQICVGKEFAFSQMKMSTYVLLVFYALDRSFASILASFAPPVVGILSQRLYGYKLVPRASSQTVEIETDRENAASLAKALYTAITIPMTICCFIYSFLYCTYPRDRARARM